jgi:NAD-dependent deacetylase
VRPLGLPPSSRIVLLTGAGVSVASGIRPYRGPGGLWSEVDVEAFVTAAAIARDPDGCFRMHQRFAALAARAEPNAAHRAIAEFACTRPPGHVTVITQNIDGLHQKAGSPRVIEIHGSLARLRCTDAACGARAPAPDPRGGSDKPPPCPHCGTLMRYDIVLFDEYLDPADERAAKGALRECDVFLAVGTSGVVFPAASYVREANYAGARTIFLNVEAPSPPNPYFDEVVLGRAEDTLPVLLGGS